MCTFSVRTPFGSWSPFPFQIVFKVTGSQDVVHWFDELMLDVTTFTDAFVCV